MKNYDSPDARPYSTASLTELATSWVMAGCLMACMAATCWPLV